MENWQIILATIIVSLSIITPLYYSYKKKKLDKLSSNNSYEEIDTRLASGWYVDSVGQNKKKKYKTKELYS